MIKQTKQCIAQPTLDKDLRKLRAIYSRDNEIKMQTQELESTTKEQNKTQA